MHRQRFVLGLAVGLMFSPAAWAILIETSPNVRIGGYFVRDDGKKLTIRIRAADGTEKSQEFDRAKIKIVHQLERARLEKLTKDNPKAYRDFADELAKHKADPEARDTAMRLYLIAAHLDPQEHGRDALVAMSALASTPAEARKCRAMAFLLDQKADAATLKAEGGKAAPLAKAEAAPLQEFLKALYAYRTGQIAAARNHATRDGVDKVFALAPGKMDRKAFLQRCTDANCSNCKSKGKFACNNCGGKGIVAGLFGQVERCNNCNGLRIINCTNCDGTGVVLSISDEVLRSLIQSELWAVDQLAGADPIAKKGGDASWSTVLRARQVAPVSALTLETITEFDPRQCIYKNGKWTAP